MLGKLIFRLKVQFIYMSESKRFYEAQQIFALKSQPLIIKAMHQINRIFLFYFAEPKEANHTCQILPKRK